MSSTPGIIFDMDGLLLDTERIARIAWQEAARRAGHEMPDALFALMIGRSKRDSGELMRAQLGPNFEFEKIHAATAVLFEEILERDGLPLKPGARELLEHLAARQAPLAVATSTRNPVAARRLEQLGLLRYFPVLVTGDQVTHGKPAPDIYRLAAQRLGIDPAASFALEDSHAGIRSAHGAGLKVIMVPDLLPPTPEIAALTHAIVPSLHAARAILG
jgi:HAD superfamily hydrolase (TIGR01509 family)